MTTSGDSVTAVLVHAAWADGSSWGKVISSLRRRSLPVRAVQIPLTSIDDDAAAITRLLDQIDGRLVLVGHSYGGVPITALPTSERVKALVFIAGMAPDEGETIGALLRQNAASADPPIPVVDGGGFLWQPLEAFRTHVAPDATTEEAAVMGMTQRPIAAQCLSEVMGPPAWRNTPSYFLVAEKDRMISPITQRFLSERMGAQLRPHPVDHTPLVSAPECVADLILEAACAST